MQTPIVNNDGPYVLWIEYPLYWVGVALGFIFATTSSVVYAQAGYLMKEGGLDWRHLNFHFSIGVIISSVTASFFIENSNRLFVEGPGGLPINSWISIAGMVCLQAGKTGITFSC